jgi:predicted outer membrane protein
MFRQACAFSEPRSYTMKAYVALAALMAAITTPAAAQPAAAQPAMAPAGAAVPALTPQSFRAAAVISDTFELESSRIALERSRNPRVRGFAQQMIQDHTMTSRALMGGSAGVGVPTGVVAGAVVGGLVGGPVGAVVGAGVGGTTAAVTGGGAPVYAAGPTLDARRADMLNRLVAARGPQFDRLYGQMQVAAHREAVALFSTYAQVGTDPNLRVFAQQTLPHLQNHMALARSLPGAGRPARRG